MTAQYPFTIQQRHGDVWLTAAGETFAELYTRAAELFGEEKANELLALAQAENVVREAGMTPPASAPASRQASSPPASKPPAPPAGPRSGPPRSSSSASSDDWKANPPVCDHGEMRPYEGSNSRGPYKAWFCSGSRDLPRDQKCTPLDGVTYEPWK